MNSSDRVCVCDCVTGLRDVTGDVTGRLRWNDTTDGTFKLGLT